MIIIDLLFFFLALCFLRITYSHPPSFPPSSRVHRHRRHHQLFISRDYDDSLQGQGTKQKHATAQKEWTVRCVYFISLSISGSCNTEKGKIEDPSGMVTMIG